MKKILFIVALVATVILSAYAQVVNDSTVTVPQEESMVMKVENWYANNMNYLSITFQLCPNNPSQLFLLIFHLF